MSWVESPGGWRTHKATPADSARAKPESATYMIALQSLSLTARCGFRSLREELPPRVPLVAGREDALDWSATGQGGALRHTLGSRAR